MLNTACVCVREMQAIEWFGMAVTSTAMLGGRMCLLTRSRGAAALCCGQPEVSWKFEEVKQRFPICRLCANEAVGYPALRSPIEGAMPRWLTSSSLCLPASVSSFTFLQPPADPPAEQEEGAVHLAVVRCEH